MKYGYFSKDGKEYVVTNPETPRDWQNHISNDRYGMVLSQAGLGYSVLPQPDGNRVTYYNPEIENGKYAYIRDNDTGEYWSSNWVPVRKKYTDFECRHGLGWTSIKTITNGIESRLRVFVPLNDPLELWTIRIKNISRKKRRLSLFPFIEWHLAAYATAWDKYLWYLEAEYRRREGLIVATLGNPLFPGRYYHGFMGVDFKFGGYDCRRDSFLGSEGSLAHPQAIRQGRCSNSRMISGERAVGVFIKRFILSPGKEKEFNIMIGFSNSSRARKRYRAKYLQGHQVEKSFQEVKGHWQRVIDHISFTTPDSKFDRMANIWLKYNVYLLNRSLREGMKGCRDVLQDCLATRLLDSQMAKKAILSALRYQYEDGSAPRQWSISAGPHDTRIYNDSALWLIFALSSYLKETGDYSILKEKVPYFESKKADTVYGHLVKAVDWIDGLRGSHNLILIGQGDWSDSLTGPGRKGKGESIWLSEAFHSSLLEMADICELKGDKSRAKRYRTKANALKKAINKSAWDGKWYLRAFTDSGSRVGSARNRYGSIYLNPQAWAIISGVATPERAAQCLDSVDEHLDTKYGPLTLWPPYQKFDKKIGRLSMLGPGHGEGANIYCHAAIFNILANLKAGRGDKAFETIEKLAPQMEKHDPELTRCTPYALTNCYGGPSVKEKFGLTLYSWYSSSCNWLFLIATEWVLGARATHRGLFIDPCLPSKWKEARIIRPFRGAIYDITIRNPKKLKKGKLKITVDGEKILGQVIEPHQDRKIHLVQVIMS